MRRYQSSRQQSIYPLATHQTAVRQSNREDAKDAKEEDLARELGVSSQTIGRWELGKNVPTFTVKQIEALEKLLASIGRSIGDLPDNL